MPSWQSSHYIDSECNCIHNDQPPVLSVQLSSAADLGTDLAILSQASTSPPQASSLSPSPPSHPVITIPGRTHRGTKMTGLWSEWPICKNASWSFRRSWCRTLTSAGDLAKRLPMLRRVSEQQRPEVMFNVYRMLYESKLQSDWTDTCLPVLLKCTVVDTL